jgi:hypothetical protein
MPKLNNQLTAVRRGRTPDFEKLGVFYLGRPYDLATKQAKEGLLLYDSKDLVTHAVCIGMTGSGKTGLGIALLEEAAIDGIPALIIDPKGDLGNLGLRFPQLRPEDFLPWINEDEARKQGLTPADYAKQQADLWAKGLASWHQDGTRIARFREAAEVVIYTPGSQAGLPVSILQSFVAPPSAIRDDEELLRERVNITASSLLGLLGIQADPIKSREHILVATILHQAWTKGTDLDLAELIRHIRTPPVSKLGVLDLDAVFPSKDRFALATQLNNLLAAPGFSVWLEGEALDIQNLLYTAQGKPRLAIFSIAHLADAERMFFVSLLLNQLVGWMRAQSGTTSLRAILYMDEIFGYLPPVANPPSKQPLLTLLKQARAFGVGVVVATQNPVDLDYKALANAGTWFIGRLQTERDKARVLEGLEGAAITSGQRFDQQQMEHMLAGLGSRIFLMHNVHDDAPVVFETRWTLSYLRGPLTRTQIKTLMDPVKRGRVGGQEKTGTPPPVQVAGLRSLSTVLLHAPPVLPSDVPQYFAPVPGTPLTDVTYRPTVFGAATVHVADPKLRVDVTRDLAFVTPIVEGPVPVDWELAEVAPVGLRDLRQAPQIPARFAPLPADAVMARNYSLWGKEFANWLTRRYAITVYRSPSSGQVSQPDESERDFRVRLLHTAHERRDRAVQQLREKYAPKLAALQERKRRAEQAVERETDQARVSTLQTALAIGATLLEAFMGRKAIKTSTIGRATSAIRGAGRAMRDARDVQRAKENVEAIDRQIAELEARFNTEVDALMAAVDPLTEQLEVITLKPVKSGVSVKLVALLWMPFSP